MVKIICTRLRNYRAHSSFYCTKIDRRKIRRSIETRCFDSRVNNMKNVRLIFYLNYDNRYKHLHKYVRKNIRILLLWKRLQSVLKWYTLEIVVANYYGTREVWEKYSCNSLRKCLKRYQNRKILAGIFSTIYLFASGPDIK